MTPTNEAGHGLPELPVPWSDYWASKGNWALSRNYAAFELADEWLKANLDALALSRGVPADMVLVPREPTHEMIDASMDVLPTMHALLGRKVYAAMIAAAPAAAGAQGEDWFGDVLASAGEVIPMQPATLSDAALIAGWEAKAASYDKLGPEEDGGDPTGDKAKTLRDCAAELRSRIALQLAPQPAAADGGVREALEVIDECADGTWLMTRDRCKRLRLAKQTLEAALSSHRQAGDPVAEVRGYGDGGGVTMCWTSGKLAIGTKLYTAPPPGPDLSKFRELAERWRDGVGIDLETRLQCADDLLALVEKGAGS